MKLICQKNDLFTALEIIIKAVNSNNTLAILDNVLLKAENKNLYFLTTNLDISINFHIPVEIKNEGSITIPAKKFYEYISFITDDIINLEKITGETLFIKSKSTTTKIKGISSEEFPQMPIFEQENALKIQSKLLNQAIDQTIFTCAINSIRPVLSGIYFSVVKKSLILVGTDSYRLAEKTITLDKSYNFTNPVIIPSKTMSEVGKLITKEDREIEILVSKNQIQFIIGAIQLTSRLIDGVYPDYQKIIPKQNKTEININSKELILTLKRLNVFARDNNFFITLATQKNKLILTTKPLEVGEQETELSTKISGDDVKIALNSKYLLDILAVIKEDGVRLQIGEANNPILISAVKDKSLRSIIMPLKI